MAEAKEFMSESTLERRGSHPHAAEALAGMCAQSPERWRFDLWGAHSGPIGSTWRIRPRRLDGHLLMLVDSGRCRYQIERGSYLLEPGSLLWMSEGVANACDPVGPEALSFSVLRLRMMQHATGRDFSRLSEPAWALELLDAAKVSSARSLFDLAVKHYRLARGHKQWRLNLAHAAIHQLLGVMAESLGASVEQASPDPRIAEARKFIDDHPLHRPRVEELAGRAGLSERYFASLFKRQVGLSPKQYEIEARMRYARSLLMVSGMNVQQCALSLGYPDAFGFSRQFRRVIGRPPSSFTGPGEH
jgi:AraC-like DNA-binding protein